MTLAFQKLVEPISWNINELWTVVWAMGPKIQYFDRNVFVFGAQFIN